MRTSSWLTKKRRDGHTDAGNNNTRRAKLASGKNGSYCPCSLAFRVLTFTNKNILWHIMYTAYYKGQFSPGHLSRTAGQKCCGRCLICHLIDHLWCQNWSMINQARMGHSTTNNNCYSPIITWSSFMENTYNRHPIACPWGQAMGCLLWVQTPINFWQ